MLFLLSGTIIVLFAVWTAVGIISVHGIEEPAFEIIKETDIYEIRKYASQIVAQTEADGSYSEALNQGFRVVADYIFGNNVSNQKIAMTATVVQNAGSEKIAMTVPVLSSEKTGNRFSISFVMPSKYTLQTLPNPNNPKVKLVEIPERTVAVIKFSGYASGDKIQNRTMALKSALQKDGIVALRFESARYNPPWTPPFLMRNEVWGIIKE